MAYTMLVSLEVLPNPSLYAKQQQLLFIRIFIYNIIILTFGVI